MKKQLLILINLIALLLFSNQTIAQNVVYPIYPSCGNLGIVIVANGLGIPVTLDNIEKKSGVLNGIQNFKMIIEESKHFNIGLFGVKGGLEPLKQSTPPLIVAVTPEHFTVIREIQELGVKTIDNSSIETFQTWEEFEPTFRQAALIVKDFTLIKN